MSTHAPRGITASPGNRPARLVGVLVVALLSVLLVTSSAFAADVVAVADTPTDTGSSAATTPLGDLPTGVGNVPAATDADTTDTSPAPATPPASTGGTTTPATPAQDADTTPATPASGTPSGIYAPDPPVVDPTTTVSPTGGPDAVPTTSPLVITGTPDAPVPAADAKPGTATTTVATKAEATDGTTAGRDTSVAPQLWSTAAVPDAVPVTDAKSPAVTGTATGSPDTPSAVVGVSANVTALTPTPRPLGPTGEGSGRDVAPATASTTVETVRQASPRTIDGEAPVEFTTPVLRSGGGSAGLLEVLAGYVIPGAANPASGVILVLFPVAILLAGLTPRLPRLHLQGIVSESGGGAPGFNPVALRPG